MGISERFLAARVACGRQYFEDLNSALSGPWIIASERLAELAESGSANRLLPLLHPEWLPSVESQRRAQGPRGVPLLPGLHSRCQSDLLWGYSCPFDDGLELDHLFPYALGGPSSTDGNAIVLCCQHNRMKAHDIHLLPWEDESRWNWVSAQVERMSRLVA